MYQRAVKQLGVPAVVALAAVVVTLYCLWGASVLAAERAAFAQSGPHVTLGQ